MEVKHKFGLKVVLCIFCCINKGQCVTKKAMCYDSNKIDNIQCGPNEIIDINLVTIALFERWKPCTEERLVPAIESLTEPCKRSVNQNRQPDGPKVYERCHGQRSCQINYQVVPKEYLSTNCGPGGGYSNVLFYYYSCVPVGVPSSGTALLPLQPPLEQVSGRQIDLFSPYYPCTSPAGYYNVTCTVTPQRSYGGSEVLFSIVPKLLTFQRASYRCDDYLHFKDGGSPVGKYHCSGTYGPRHSWNGNVSTVTTIHNLEVGYRANVNSQGGKFWLQIKALEGGSEVLLGVSCSGQDNIPKPSSSCSPLIYAPPVPTTESTTATNTEPPEPIDVTPRHSVQDTSRTVEEILTTTAPPQITKETETISQGTDDPIGVNTLIGGLSGMTCVIIIIAVTAFVLACKLRKKNAEMEQRKTAEEPESRSEGYITILDPTDAEPSGYGPQVPAALDLVAPVNDPYEEIAANSSIVDGVGNDSASSYQNMNIRNELHGYLNGAFQYKQGGIIEPNVQLYEEIPENKAYESLSQERVVYDNAKEKEMLKLYTKLDID